MTAPCSTNWGELSFMTLRISMLGSRPVGGGALQTWAMRPLDFSVINGAALPVLPALLRHWLPDGRLEGSEYVARNPTRPDRRPGSFKINVSTGKWADFATGDKGGDVVSLAAYLARISQADAAVKLASMLGKTDD